MRAVVHMQWCCVCNFKLTSNTQWFSIRNRARGWYEKHPAVQQLKPPLCVSLKHQLIDVKNATWNLKNTNQLALPPSGSPCGCSSELHSTWICWYVSAGFFFVVVVVVLGWNLQRVFTTSRGLCMKCVHKHRTNRKIVTAPAEMLHGGKMKCTVFHYLHKGVYAWTNIKRFSTVGPLQPPHNPSV